MPAENVRTLNGHSGSVLAVAFSPDGKILASGSRDHKIQLWDVQTGSVLRTLDQHIADVYDVVFSRGGELLASGGGDKVIKLWNPRTGEVIRTLEGHRDIVRSAAFSPDQKGAGERKRGHDGSTVGRGDGDVEADTRGAHGTGHVRRLCARRTNAGERECRTEPRDYGMWVSGEEKARFEGHDGGLESVAFSPGGKLVATSSQDGTVRLWDVETGKTRHVLKGHIGEVDSVTFSPNGETVVKWLQGPNHQALGLPNRALCTAPLTGHTGRVESLAISPDGQTLAIGGRRG